jgi:anti-anti-sigma factor
MFEINKDGTGVVKLTGRLDAAQVEKADEVLDLVTSSCKVDFSGLDYISSAGLGVLLKTQQRLNEDGHSITLVGLSPHIRQVFEYAGFNLVFTIE